MKHITRLKKLREKEEKTIVKKASFEIPLEFLDLDSGDSINFFVRTVNNKPWYCIKHEHPWEASTFYDGSDFARACSIYKQLLMTFSTISSAESFAKSVPSLANKIEKFYTDSESTRDKFQEYHNLIQKSPKYLGFNDF